MHPHGRGDRGDRRAVRCSSTSTRTRFTLDPGELADATTRAHEGDRPRAPLRPVRRHGRDLGARPRARARRARGRGAGARRGAATAGGRARSAPRRRSASIRRRTSARSATAARSSRTTPRSPRRRASCGASASGPAARPCAAGRTAGSTRSRRRCSRVKLPHLERWNERRRDLAARYREALTTLVLLQHKRCLTLPTEAAGAHHVYHLYVVRSPRRATLWRRRSTARGIGTLVHYPRAVHQHPAYAHLARPGRLGAERAPRPRGAEPAALSRAHRRRGRTGGRSRARGVRCLSTSRPDGSSRR